MYESPVNKAIKSQMRTTEKILKSYNHMLVINSPIVQYQQSLQDIFPSTAIAKIIDENYRTKMKRINEIIALPKYDDILGFNKVINVAMNNLKLGNSWMNENQSAVNQIISQTKGIKAMQNQLNMSIGLNSFSHVLTQNKLDIAGINTVLKLFNEKLDLTKSMKINAQVSMMKELVQVISKTLPVSNEVFEIDFDELNEYMNEELIDDNFQPNTEKIKKQPKTKQIKIKRICQCILVVIGFFANVSGILDSQVFQTLLENITGIVCDVTNKEIIEVYGHIVQDADVYDYCSKQSLCNEMIFYGTPIEVIEYHSGWLKIKYKNMREEIVEGWILEENAIWSYVKK